jgi:protein phosphatase
MEDPGLLSAAEASRHRLRHVLTQALGAGGVDVQVLDLTLGDVDRLLLCTDGLANIVDDGQIAALLTQASEPQTVCQSLVDRALANGGRDNVTAVLEDYHLTSFLGRCPEAVLDPVPIAHHSGQGR